VSRRGHALAEATDGAWPTEFEAATVAYLRRELGVDFGR
jgi:hypothetical protein